MITLVCQYLLTFKCEPVSGAPEDWVSSLLSEQGEHGNPPVLMDWAYAGPDSPKEIEPGTFTANVFLLMEPQNNGEDGCHDALDHLFRQAQDLTATRCLLPFRDIEVAEDYTEGDFIKQAQALAAADA